MSWRDRQEWKENRERLRCEFRAVASSSETYHRFALARADSGRYTSLSDGEIYHGPAAIAMAEKDGANPEIVARLREIAEQASERTEASTQSKPEPKAAAKPKPKAAAKPKPEAAAKPKPKAAATPKAKPKATPKAATQTKAKPKPKGATEVGRASAKKAITKNKNRRAITAAESKGAMATLLAKYAPWSPW